MKSSDRFGINMKRYCRKHEARVTEAIAGGEATQELYEDHMEMIRIVQYERLIHLIVTAIVVIAELFVVDLVLVHPELGVIPAIIMLCLAVLLGFYFYHYFFLENTVQRWYRMADELKQIID